MAHYSGDLKGFTLIELAIVVTVIGFLVAGISAGSALIDNARLQSVISDYTRYQTSYIAFKSRYNAIPGDMNNASAWWPGCTPNDVTSCNGNGNSRIQTNHSIFDNATMEESFRAWRHLFLAGLIQSGGINSDLDTFNSVSDWASVNRGAFPTSRIPGATYMFAAGTYSFYPQTSESVHPWFPNLPNILYIIRANTYGNVIILKSLQAQAIDLKTDDGNPVLGVIRSLNDPFDCGLNTNCFCKTGSTYILTSTVTACLVGRTMDN